MTRHERALIRSCLSNGFTFRRNLKVRISEETDDDTTSWDRFNAIVEEVEVALDKQEPLMPTDITSTHGYKVGTCGACCCGVDEGMEYCVQCGQKIDWECVAKTEEKDEEGRA